MHFVNDPKFKVPSILYHGSFTEIQQFDPDWLGTHTGDSTESFYFTSNPKVAADYAMQSFKSLYEDDPDKLAEDGLVDEDEIPEDWYEAFDFIDALAVDHGRVMHAKIEMENPLIIECECNGIQDVWEWIGEDNGMADLMNWIRNPHCNACPGDLWIEIFEYYCYYEDPDNEESNMVFPEFDGLVLRRVIDSVGELSTLIQDVYIVPTEQQITVLKAQLIENELLTF